MCFRCERSIFEGEEIRGISLVAGIAHVHARWCDRRTTCTLLSSVEYSTTTRSQRASSSITLVLHSTRTHHMGVLSYGEERLPFMTRPFGCVTVLCHSASTTKSPYQQRMLAVVTFSKSAYFPPKQTTNKTPAIREAHRWNGETTCVCLMSVGQQRCARSADICICYASLTLGGSLAISLQTILSARQKYI
jgi:hypothetical protein